MNKPWNDSELAKASADLDEELTAIFDQVEKTLKETEPWDEVTGIAESAPSNLAETDGTDFSALSPADLLANDDLADLDIDIARENALPFLESEAAEAEWLPPGLLGEPETPAGLTPEALRELSRLIEAAVEKGVAAALAKLKN